ncbi:hypothetical protein GCM10027443_26470 [Pontibacter brevis]
MSGTLNHHSIHANGLARSYRSAFTLMRVPFSIYLMPIFWFALSTVMQYDVWRAIAVFLVLHLLVYPASNGYNSYYDRDEGSIGGLKHPPKVTQQLMHLVLLFDVLAVIFSFMLSPLFGILVIPYLLISKAYSYEGIRLKKYPFLSTLIVTFFQGAFTYLMVQIGVGFTLSEVLLPSNVWFALVSTLLLCGSYPLSQIYQHEEDSHRGDRTLSLVLGVKGTYLFAAISLSLGTALLLYLYLTTSQAKNIFIFLFFTAPILYFFTGWMRKAKHDLQVVNYENTMQMNKLSSLCISLAFICIIVVRLYL